MGRPKAPPRHLTACRLDAATESFLAYVRTLVSTDSGTPAAKAVIMRGLVERLGASRPVWTLTCGDFDDVAMWIINGADEAEAARRRAEGRKPRTGRKTRGSIAAVGITLRQFAEHARRHQWLDNGVTLLDEIVKSHKERLDGDAEAAEPLRIPRQQWPDMLARAEQIHARCRMAVALGLHCGRRVSEVVGLQWKHIDWTAQTIRFYNVKRGRWLTLPLFPEIRSEIERWREWAEREYGPVQADWYLVPSRTPNPRGGPASLVILRRQSWRWPVNMTQKSSTETVNKDVRRLLAQLGIGANEGTGTHTWRRSAAQEVAREHGLAVAQVFLDHKSVVTTQRYTGTAYADEQLWNAFMGEGGAAVTGTASAPHNTAAAAASNVIPFRPKRRAS